MNPIIQFITKAMQDGLTNTPSARRVTYVWFAALGGIAMSFGIGVATCLLFGFDQAERLSYYKETLSYIEWMFLTGIAGTGMAYGLTKVAEGKLSKQAGKNESSI